MAITQLYTLIRKAEVLRQTGLGKSTFYNHIQKGLMVKAVSLGDRSSSYPLHEINAINAARIAGHTEDEIKSLVCELMNKRKELI